MADAPAQRRPRGAAVMVAAGIFLSRIAGLLRARLFGYYFGAKATADVFNAALKIPNVLQNLFGEGALSASFIPVYANLLARDEKEEAGRVAGAIFAILALLTSILVMFGNHANEERLVTLVAEASVVGSALQFLAQLPVVLRLVPSLRIRLATHRPSVRTVMRNFGPAFVGRGVVQITAYIDTVFAT